MNTTSFVINPTYQHAEALDDFLKSSCDSTSNTLLAKNTRNAVFELTPSWAATPVIKKRSQPNPHYRLSRKISFYSRNLFRHYGRRGYKGALLLQEKQIPTIMPLAYWKEKVGPLQFQSCLAYEKLEADFDMKQFLESVYDESNETHRTLLRPLYIHMAKLARQLHDSGLVHGDLVPNNFLVKLLEPSSPQSDDTQKFVMYVIDTDHTITNWLPTRLLRDFFAMRCFRRIAYPPEMLGLFLRQYKGSPGSTKFYELSIRYWHWRDKRPFSQLRKKVLGQKIPEKEKPKEKKTQPLESVQAALKIVP